MYGSEVMIILTTHWNNQTFPFFKICRVDHLKWHKTPDRIFDIVFYTIVSVIAILLIVLFRIWQGRISQIVNTITQKQADNMSLDLIKSITNRNMLEVIADLTRDETMEIERENIALLEALGEGAFGLVKKAILVKDGSKHQVAVKMLKSEINFIFYPAQSDSFQSHF